MRHIDCVEITTDGIVSTVFGRKDPWFVRTAHGVVGVSVYTKDTIEDCAFAYTWAMRTDPYQGTFRTTREENIGTLTRAAHALSHFLQHKISVGFKPLVYSPYIPGSENNARFLEGLRRLGGWYDRDPADGKLTYDSR